MDLGGTATHTRWERRMASLPLAHRSLTERILHDWHFTVGHELGQRGRRPWGCGEAVGGLFPVWGTGSTYAFDENAMIAPLLAALP